MKKKDLTYNIRSSLKLIETENSIDPKEQEQKYNHALIHLRKRSKLLTEQDKAFALKVLHFNKVVKSKEIDEVADLIKYFIRKA